MRKHSIVYVTNIYIRHTTINGANDYSFAQNDTKKKLLTLLYNTAYEKIMFMDWCVNVTEIEHKKEPLIRKGSKYETGTF